jgi:CHAD domain-containing protein
MCAEWFEFIMNGNHIVKEPCVGIPNSKVASGNGSGEQGAWEWARLRKFALHQMDKFIDLVPLVLRNDDLTSVNRMRVTCRRLEQVVDLLYVKPRPRDIKELRRGLRLYRRTLGELRNCDALLVLAEHCIAEQRPGNAAAEAMRDYLQQYREKIAIATLEKLGRINLAGSYLRMKSDFGLGTNHSGKIQKASTPLSAETVRERIMHSLADRWKEFVDAVERSHHDPGRHVIHRMRIAAKRLRYLTEVMAKLHIQGSKETLKWLISLQTSIGVWHDMEILEGKLREIMIHQRKLPGGHVVSVNIERIINHNRETKTESEKRFFPMTRHSPGYQKVKQWVASIVAYHAKGVHQQKRVQAAPRNQMLVRDG